MTAVVASSIALIVAGAWAGGLDGYKRVAPVFEKPKLMNPGFETGTDSWTLPGGYRHDPRGGRSGTGALRVARTEAGQYTLSSQTISLQPGMRYRFGVWVKTENVQGEDSGGTICIEFHDRKGWMGGAYIDGIKGTRDWTWIEGSGSVPENAVKCTITPYLRKGMTGKVWFDDVKIEPEVGTWSADQIFPSHGRIDPKRGRIVLGSFASGRFVASPKQLDEKNLACLIKAVKGERTVKEMTVPVHGNRIEAELGPLPEGDLTLNLTLLETRQKWILGETAIPAAVVAAGSPPPNACRLDEYGRAMVGGEPFLPVGLYCSGLKREDIDRLAASPFNCVMPYESMALKFGGSSRIGVAAINEVLDACHAGNLKMIFSIKDVFAPGKDVLPRVGNKTTFFGAEGEQAVVEKVVRSFKDHPALLAWYVNDELSVDVLPRLIARRKEVNSLDPEHPTWSVLYQFDELKYHGPTCDILGIDPYPIENDKSKDMRWVLRGLERAEHAVGTKTGMALWVVPQVFNWGAYRTKDRKQLLKSFRNPTEIEMRAMALLCALKGAKGFIFYSYFDLFRPHTLPDFEHRWPEICRVGDQL